MPSMSPRWCWKGSRNGRMREHALARGPAREPAGHPTAYNAAMLARALIVLLLVLNLGVATWWATRQPPPTVPLVQPPGVARLQLLSEVPARQTVRPVAVAPPVTEQPDAAATAPVPAQCFSFGPYADAAAAATARARLQPMATRVATREQAATPSRGWRVQMPPQASSEAAQAMAERIAAAGFSDFMIVREGTEANAIALGRYGSEDTARRRAAALTAAGFDARPEPLGDARPTTWLDVLAGAGFDPHAAQAAAAAPTQRPLDCTRLQ